MSAKFQIFGPTKKLIRGEPAVGQRPYVLVVELGHSWHAKHLFITQLQWCTNSPCSWWDLGCPQSQPLRCFRTSCMTPNPFRDPMMVSSHVPPFQARFATAANLDQGVATLVTLVDAALIACPVWSVVSTNQCLFRRTGNLASLPPICSSVASPSSRRGYSCGRTLAMATWGACWAAFQRISASKRAQ